MLTVRKSFTVVTPAPAEIVVSVPPSWIMLMSAVKKNWPLYTTIGWFGSSTPPTS